MGQGRLPAADDPHLCGAEPAVAPQFERPGDRLAAARAGETIDEVDPPTPGTRSINLGGETEFLAPVFVGDRLGSARRLVDVYIKKIRIDPEAFWLVTDTLYYNQDEQVVAV